MSFEVVVAAVLMQAVKQDFHFVEAILELLVVENCLDLHSGQFLHHLQANDIARSFKRIKIIKEQTFLEI